MADSIDRRLGRLELVWRAPVCPTCVDKPHRIVTVDADTDEVISESMPADGCPRCETPVFREYHLVADHSDAAKRAG